MKWSGFLYSGTTALVLSLGVTVGSLYVTVSAAVSNLAATDATEVSVPVAVSRTSITVDSTFCDVPLTADGSLTARFSGINVPSGELEPASDLEVTLVSADGTEITTSTAVDGLCLFSNVTPGPYTINVAGPQGRLSYGIRAVTGDVDVAETQTGNKAVPVSVSLAPRVDSALAPSRDSAALDSVISSVIVTPVEGTAASSGGAAMETGMGSASAAAETYLGHEPIRLNLDGSLEGQLALLDPVTGNVTPVKDLTVRFISNDEVVAITTVNPDGSFVQSNMLPGIYSMVVAGSDAIGYIGIEVVGAMANRPGAPIPATVRKLAPFQFGLIRGAGALCQSEGEETGEAEIVAAGGIGGACCGASGGASGGGGWGELLGLAGLAVGLVALDDDGPSSPGF